MILADITINWTGIAALLTGTAGLVAAYAALVRAKSETRKQADGECEQKLLQAREDAMKASDELYNIRMRRRDTRPEELAG